MKKDYLSEKADRKKTVKQAMLLLVVIVILLFAAFVKLATGL
jgi:hypothetical protein